MMLSLYTRSLRDADDGDTPQDGAMITTLVTGGSPALDQSLRLIKWMVDTAMPLRRATSPTVRLCLNTVFSILAPASVTISARKTRKHSEEQPV